VPVLISAKLKDVVNFAQVRSDRPPLPSRQFLRDHRPHRLVAHCAMNCRSSVTRARRRSIRHYLAPRDCPLGHVPLTSSSRKSGRLASRYAISLATDCASFEISQSSPVTGFLNPTKCIAVASFYAVRLILWGLLQQAHGKERIGCVQSVWETDDPCLSDQRPLNWPIACDNSGMYRIKVRSCPSEARCLLYGNTLWLADWAHLLGNRKKITLVRWQPVRSLDS